MDIFRHYYTPAELNTLVFHNTHLNNFGFCNLDGSKINYNWGIYTPLDFRYTLDTKKQSYLHQDIPSNSYYTSYHRELSRIGFHRSDGSTSYMTESRAGTARGYQTTSPATVVFIPLINNGFLLNIRSLNYDYGYLSGDPTTDSNDPRDKTFNPNTPSPSLNVKIYGTNDMYTNWYGGIYGPACIINLIGIPPCKANLNWTYIFYGNTNYASPYNDSGGGYYNHLIDYGDGRVMDLPYRSNFIRTRYGPTAYNEPTYTNINENICTMIKMPYDNGYIDGLYLLTTSPQPLEDATFFSFEGRNFLNVFDNYVVELPSSS